MTIKWKQGHFEYLELTVWYDNQTKTWLFNKKTSLRISVSRNKRIADFLLWWRKFATAIQVSGSQNVVQGPTAVLDGGPEGPQQKWDNIILPMIPSISYRLTTVIMCFIHFLQ